MFIIYAPKLKLNWIKYFLEHAYLQRARPHTDKLKVAANSVCKKRDQVNKVKCSSQFNLDMFANSKDKIHKCRAISTKTHSI
jgi:hypothetical protein